MTITDGERRAVAGWAADCAEHVLAIFETAMPGDDRPREAIAVARRFAQGDEGRSRHLSRLAMDAHRAGTEVGGGAMTAPAAAARAASLAAAAANTHHETTVGTLRHVLGSAIHAVLARELADGGVGAAGDEMRRAITAAPPEVRDLVRRLPPPGELDSRPEAICRELDAELRSP